MTNNRKKAGRPCLPDNKKMIQIKFSIPKILLESFTIKELRALGKMYFINLKNQKNE